MYSNRKQSIYELCSENTGIALQLYCDCINRSKAEIFIVMAQKAVCLFELLLKEGLIKREFKDKYISSSSLNFGFKNLLGKKIAIIDDIIISGSAISSTVNTLVSNGINEDDLEIIALVRNSNYQTMQFTHRKTQNNLLSCALEALDAECIEISYDISHILAYNGKPYDADFPSYNSFNVNKNTFINMNNQHDWDLYDITNDVHRFGNIKAFTLFPKKRILEYMWDTLGVNLDDIVHLKLRMYCRDYANGKSLLETVPMALFCEITERNVDLLFNYFSSQEVLKLSGEWGYAAKLRFLQFYIAHTLQKIFSKYVLNSDLCLLHEPLHYTFGDLSYRAVINCLEKPEIKAKTLKLEKNDIVPDDLGYHASFTCKTLIKNDDNKGYEINQALYNSIQWWYENQELPTRQQLKKPVKHFINDYLHIKECTKRLRKGYSFNALKEIIADAGNFFELDYLVSLFIDRGVDEGIVVPIVYHNEDKHYLCRAYRHGEDLPFGEADKSRILYYLKCFDLSLRNRNGNKTEHFATISMEKIIILFYQLGLKNKRIFNRFLGFGNDAILQQRFNVHGIVAAVKEKYDEEKDKNSHFYLSSENDNDNYSANMVTRLLCEYPESYLESYEMGGNNKYYIINTDKITEYLDSSKLNNISEEIKNEIESIAIIIGGWYFFESKGSGKGEFKENICALTSCSDIYTFASAIATSIHFFKLYWQKEARSLLILARQGNEIYDFSSNRFHQALPSARDKHKWYKNELATKVIDSVKNILLVNGLNNECEIWNKYWRSRQTTQLLGSNELNKLTNDALKFMYFYSECYDWLCKRIMLNDKCSQTIDRRYYNEYKEFSENDSNDRFKIFARIEKMKNVRQRIKFFIDVIDSFVLESECVVQGIENCLSEITGTYTVNYSSALVVEIEHIGEEFSEEFFRDVWKALPENSEKTYLNIVKIESDNENFDKYGVFHENSDDDAVQMLLDCYNLIHKNSCRYGCSTKTVFIPLFPNGIKFQHNLRSNISKYAKDFSEKISSCISKIKYSNNVHQFVVLKTWDISDDLIEFIDEKLVDYKRIKLNDFVENDKVFYDYFVCGECFKTEKLVSATVRIEVDGVPQGTGVLFRFNGNIYCISCQHLLNEKEEDSKITATVANNKHVFSLEPINYSKQSLDCSHSASEEVLIFSTNLENQFDFNNESFFCEDDCIYDIDKLKLDEKYSIFGFAKTADSYGRIETNIKKNGFVANGFLQMDSKNSYIEEGQSGAAIVIENTNKLVGFHAKNDKGKNKILVIPTKIVLNTLHKVLD